MRMALDGAQGKLWTALPGIINSFDPSAMTCTVQPAINGWRRFDDGHLEQIKLPMLLDCPVCFPGGGGCTLTFPIKQGDECLMVFSSRCIDSWWQLGGVQSQAEIRMHDLSDGFVLPGVRSQPRKFSVSTSAAQLRSDDGAAFVEINTSTKNIKAKTSAGITAEAGGNIEATAGGSMTAQSSGAMSLTAPTITLNGAVQVNGTLSQGGGNATMTGSLAVTGDVTAGGKSLKTHVHSGVQGGTSNTGQPV